MRLSAIMTKFDKQSNHVRLENFQRTHHRSSESKCQEFFKSETFEFRDKEERAMPEGLIN